MLAKLIILPLSRIDSTQAIELRFRLSLTHNGSNCQSDNRSKFRPLIGALLAAVFAAGCNAFDQDPYTQLEQARAYVAQSNHRAAVIALKTALQADPDIAGAHRMLGEIYLLLGDNTGAERELIRAIELGESSAEVQMRLAHALVQQAEYDRALSLIESIPTPSSPAERSQLALLTGRLYQSRGDLSKARVQFEAALSDRDGEASGHLGLARLALANNDWEGFETQIELAQTAGATSGDLAVERGEAALLKHQPELAQGFFSAAIDYPTNELQARLGLTRSLLANADLQAALASAQNAVRRFPRSAPAYYLLALARHRLDNTQNATDAVQESLRLNKNFVPSSLLLAQIQLRQGLTAQAEHTIHKVIKVRSNHVGALTLLAAIQSQQGRGSEAKQTLAPLLDLNPPPTPALKILAQLELQNGNRARGLALLQQAAADEGEAPAEEGAPLAADPRQEALLAIMRRIRNQEFDSALAEAQKYVHAHPNDVLGLNLLGTVHIARGDTDQARHYFLKAVELDDTFAPARFNLARLDMLAGDTKQAEKGLRTLLRTQPDYLDAHLALADLAFRASRNAEGLEHLLEARRSSRTALTPRIALADWYLEKARPNDALEVAQEAVDIAPAHPAALMALGRSWSALDQHRKAAEAYEKLTAAAPQSADAYFFLGASLAKFQDLDNAEIALLHARELNPQHVRTLLALGALALERGDNHSALELAHQVQELVPDSADAYGLEGDTLASRGDYVAALKPYRRAYELEPNGIRVTRLYQTYVELGRSAQAQELITNWLNENAEDIVVRLALGETHAKEGDIVGAIAVYEQVLALDRNNIVALNNLAWLYFSSSDNRALSYAQRAHRQAPELPAVLDTYGWILLNQGRHEQGMAMLKKARNRADSPDIRYHFAVALNTIGRTDEARTELEHLLNDYQKFADRSAAQSLLETLR
jgi:tetratricopeptide (TPR) repeat protein